MVEVHNNKWIRRRGKSRLQRLLDSQAAEHSVVHRSQSYPQAVLTVQVPLPKEAEPETLDSELSRPDPERINRLISLISATSPSASVATETTPRFNTIDSPPMDMASSSVPQRSRSSSNRPRKGNTESPVMAITRAVVISVGLALLVGLLSQLLQRRPANSRQDETVSLSSASRPPILALQTGLTDLQTQLQELVTDPKLGLHALFVDIDSGAYADINSDVKISAASTIKVPVLVAFFQAVDAGRVKLDEELLITQELIASGSGTLQFKPVGTKLSALSAATLMITISDNTATNLIIQRLGGLEALNQTFREWGLTATQLNALLPDLEGTNTTSAKDMVSLLSLIEKGKLLQLRSRDWVLDIMRRTQTRTLLPQGLGPEARIANKTGDIRSLVGDVGIVDMPNGRRYLASVLVARETPNDPRAQEVIRQVSQTVYQYWSGSEISSNE